MPVPLLLGRFVVNATTQIHNQKPLIPNQGRPCSVLLLLLLLLVVVVVVLTVGSQAAANDDNECGCRLRCRCCAFSGLGGGVCGGGLGPIGRVVMETPDWVVVGMTAMMVWGIIVALG